MKLHDLAGTIVAKKVLGIDASTKSYAWALIDDGELVDFGEFEFSGGNLYERMQEAQAAAVKLGEMKPDYCAIEQAVFVGNRAVTIKLAYFYGIIMGEMARQSIPFDDVSPMTWMNYIGNGRFTKEFKLQFKRDNPGESKNWYKDRLREHRKQRTMDWVKETYGKKTDNDNIADAIGVAHYAEMELTKNG